MRYKTGARTYPIIQHDKSLQNGGRNPPVDTNAAALLRRSSTSLAGSVSPLAEQTLHAWKLR